MPTTTPQWSEVLKNHYCIIGFCLFKTWSTFPHFEIEKLSSGPTRSHAMCHKSILLKNGATLKAIIMHCAMWRTHNSLVKCMHASFFNLLSDTSVIFFIQFNMHSWCVKLQFNIMLPTNPPKDLSSSKSNNITTMIMKMFQWKGIHWSILSLFKKCWVSVTVRSWDVFNEWIWIPL